MIFNTLHYSQSDPGVVYFADDDNTYDDRLFGEILQTTSKVSMFPVGLIGSTGASSPVINAQGRVIGFVTGSGVKVSIRKRLNRRFPVDMAGFAFTVKALHKYKPKMSYRATYEEEDFLKSLNLRYDEIQPLANGCTEILVWHTISYSPPVRTFRTPKDDNSINLKELLRNMVDKGVAKLNDLTGNELPTCIGLECSS